MEAAKRKGGAVQERRRKAGEITAALVRAGKREKIFPFPLLGKQVQ